VGFLVIGNRLSSDFVVSVMRYKSRPNGPALALKVAPSASEKTNRQIKITLNVTRRHLTPKNPGFSCIVRTKMNDFARC
jgi:hypothetical protein